MSIFDTMNIRTIQDEYDDYMTEDLKFRINKLKEENNIVDLPQEYRDPEFLETFFEKIPEDEQSKYVRNSTNYFLGKEYDTNYVLMFRRAVPSVAPKPEAFWTSEYNIARWGLRNEIPLNSAQRHHSYIMVTSLKKLINHGLVSTENGVSDGEIAINPNEPFTEFLFMFKPYFERYDLDKYLLNGGITREELLEKLALFAEERKEKQGFSR